METYEQNRFCPDSECCCISEPEEELTEGGTLRYWSSQCGIEFGHVLVKDEGAAPSCQLGIPAEVRALASVAPPDSPGRVFLGDIGRRPE